MEIAKDMAEEKLTSRTICRAQPNSRKGDVGLVHGIFSGDFRRPSLSLWIPARKFSAEGIKRGR